MDEDIDDIEEEIKSIENRKNVDKLKKEEGIKEKKKGGGIKEKKEEDIKEKKKSSSTLYNRCYTNKMITEFEKVEENKDIQKIDLLKIVGFFGITKMKLRRIHSEFIVWMCDNFIPSQLKVDLGQGKFLSLNEGDVNRLYNLPWGPKRIELFRCAKEEIEALRKELDVQFPRASKELVNISDIYNKLADYEDEDTWIKAIILCCIRYVLFPASNGLINLRYADCIKNIGEVIEYNWCEHILDHLRKVIRPATKYPNADFHFLIVHVMDVIEDAASSSVEPTCAKRTSDQILAKFDKLAKAKKFENVIGKKMTPAECSNLGMKSEYSVGVEKVEQMPTGQSCKSLEQCNQYIDFCNYNIKAWINCLHELKKNREELEASEGKESTVGSSLRKRKTRCHESGIGNEKNSRKSPRKCKADSVANMQKSDGKTPRRSPRKSPEVESVSNNQKSNAKTPRRSPRKVQRLTWYRICKNLMVRLQGGVQGIFQRLTLFLIFKIMIVRVQRSPRKSSKADLVCKMKKPHGESPKKKKIDATMMVDNNDRESN
ncbi:hypothetical protein LIER_17577 [Lithospermum erythrorhizon]|uniref:Uncharacterized protein n=1 Tax=Lithospermum erythrorhizon TaxID=34254 RepID=A0AAV3QAT4_LITER